MLDNFEEALTPLHFCFYFNHSHHAEFRCKLRLYNQSPNMNKCEHGERITLFCASECCVWKEAAGCEVCIKKYHNHMGTTVFLKQEEVTAIVKKYTMDNAIKPKCRVLQEAIYAHFNLLKNEVSTSLDAACKNIINQIGYPYLYAHNTLSTYKRLKNKEYKKLIQKDFRQLYELTQKINDKDLAKEQSKIYVQEMKQTEELIQSLESILTQYEKAIKKYNPAFSHDTQHFAKINDIFKNLTESPRNSQLKSHKEDKKNLSPVYQFRDSPKEKLQPSVKLEQVPSTNQSSRPQRLHTIGAPPSLNRPNYSRDVSLDKKIIKEHKFVAPNASPAIVDKQKHEKNIRQQIQARQRSLGGQEEKESKDNLVSHRQKNERIETVRQQLNSKQLEINEKKKMLIEMMKQKQDVIKSTPRDRKEIKGLSQEKNQPKDNSPTRTKPLNLKLATPGRQIITHEQEIIFKEPELSKDGSEKCVSNSESNSNAEVEDESIKAETDNRAFTQLPVEEKAPKLFEDREQLKQKVIVIPTISFNEKQNLEIHSPLLKIKTLKDRLKESGLIGESGVMSRPSEEKKKIEKDNDNILELIPIYHKKMEPQMELKENEEKSLALLLKSLNLKAQEAVVYLEKAISCAENNLSAAEYLSFIYLQLQRPTDCLKLCNRLLEKMENSSQPDDMSLILNNNKTAALNMLGRYSESIVLLERCLRYREKDYFYKNLGDAYFSISIYEKAIYNYQKALRLNDHNDEAHYNLAVCLFIQQNYHNARLSISKAIEINSLCEQYHQLLRNIQTRINHY